MDSLAKKVERQTRLGGGESCQRLDRDVIGFLVGLEAPRWQSPLAPA